MPSPPSTTSWPISPWTPPVPAGAPAAAGGESAVDQTTASQTDRDGSHYGALVLLVLAGSLVGILVLTLIIHSTYFGPGIRVPYVPTRDVYVLALALVASPYVLAIWRGRVPVLFLIAPTIIVFFLAALFSPYGLVSGRDDIFNFQFARTLLTSSSWHPGQGVSLEAVVYSYYPASGIFNAESSAMTGLPLITSAQYALPALRFLVIPAGIYALTQRLFGPRSGLLAVLLYLGTPSLTFNEVVQQEFAIVFFLLTLLLLVGLLDVPESGGTSLRVALVLVSSYVVISHHMTSYILAFFLGTLALLPYLLRGRATVPSLRLGSVAVRYLAFFLFYVLVLTAPILYGQITTLGSSVAALVSGAPLPSTVGNIGASFTTAQILWIVGSAILVVLLAMLLLVEVIRRTRLSFVVAILLTTFALVLIALGLFPTGFSFVTLRIWEYTGFVLCPAAAWWLIQRFVHWPAQGSIPRVSRTHARRRGRGAAFRATIAALLVLVIFAGGSLVPTPTRDQFEPTDSLLSDSSLFITQEAYHDALWAASHLNRSDPMWGDYLTYTVFGGFGGFTNPWDSYFVFNGTNLTASQWQRLSIGNYVVLDAYMTQIVPEFQGPATDQPSAPLTPAQLSKFSDPSYFQLVFQDSLFTIYQVSANPPGL